MNVNSVGESASRLEQAWPETLTRVPYWVYQDAEVYQAEQQRIFEGPVWNFLCLEQEMPGPGDYRSTFVGTMPVVVARDADGEIYAFENRCVHRGALIVLEDEGNARDFQCVYHAWTYDLKGNLKGIAFKDGVNGKGGMPKDFCMEQHGPRKLRVETVFGLVFGSLSDDVPPLEEYIGDEVLAKMERVLRRPVEVMGRFTQALPNNWKLYTENVRDTYHASLLHLFFTKFGITRLDQAGGVVVSESGGNHATASIVEKVIPRQEAYAGQGFRSQENNFKLRDPSILDTHEEFGDNIGLQILSVFPGFVLQQIRNCVAVRQVLPRGQEATDLNWTYLGFQGDTPEMRRVRLKQANMIGPAGYVSMEDGAVGGFVQRGIASASEVDSVIELGGENAGSENFRATEASVRGFWKAYRTHMGF